MFFQPYMNRLRRNLLMPPKITETEEEKKQRESKEQEEKLDTKMLPEKQKDSHIDELTNAVLQLADQNKQLIEKVNSFEGRLTDSQKPKAEVTEAVDFFKEPEKRLKQQEENLVNRVQSLLDQTVAPLKQRFAHEDIKDARLEVKEKFRNDPKFKILFDKGERYVDQALSNMDKVTEANMRGMLYGLLGAAQAGDIDVDLTPNRSQQEEKKGSEKMFDPPTRRPSAPPRPNPGDSGNEEMRAKVEALDENQRFEARRNGLTLEQYIQWLEEDSMNVIKSQIGVVKKEGK